MMSVFITENGALQKDADSDDFDEKVKMALWRIRERIILQAG